MSESQVEAIELPASGDAAFSALMDALAPDSSPTQAVEGGAEAPAAAQPDAGAAAEGGAAAPPAPGSDAPVAGDGAPAGGASGTPAAPAGGAAVPDAGDKAGEPAADAGAGDAAAAGGGADRPAAWTATAAELAPQLTELSQKFEERTLQAYQATALEEVKTERKQYFSAIEQHPRLLVGREVPAIGKEGTETLTSTEDAREWQDAVKQLLVAEVRSKASKALDENDGFLNTVHASIELFQKNPDLTPGTKDFDVELANRFSELAEPYELRVDGKLQGYTIPVQPIIDQLRARLVGERKAAAPGPAAGQAAGGAVSTTPPAATPPAEEKPGDPPQAGIQSKPGASAEGKEDFSTLFATAGLPNLVV